MFYVVRISTGPFNSCHVPSFACRGPLWGYFRGTVSMPFPFTHIGPMRQSVRAALQVS